MSGYSSYGTATAYFGAHFAVIDLTLPFSQQLARHMRTFCQTVSFAVLWYGEFAGSDFAETIVPLTYCLHHSIDKVSRSLPLPRVARWCFAGNANCISLQRNP